MALQSVLPCLLLLPASVGAVSPRAVRDPAGTGFGTKPGLRVDGHIFAMQVKGGLGLKLPAARVATLIGQGTGRPMATRPNRPLRKPRPTSV